MTCRLDDSMSQGSFLRSPSGLTYNNQAPPHLPTKSMRKPSPQDSASVIEPFDYLSSEKYSLRLKIMTEATSGLTELARNKDQELRDIFEEQRRLQEIRQKREWKLERDILIHSKKGENTGSNTLLYDQTSKSQVLTAAKQYKHCFHPSNGHEQINYPSAVNFQPKHMKDDIVDFAPPGGAMKVKRIKTKPLPKVQSMVESSRNDSGSFHSNFDGASDEFGECADNSRELVQEDDDTDEFD